MIWCKTNIQNRWSKKRGLFVMNLIMVSKFVYSIDKKKKTKDVKGYYALQFSAFFSVYNTKELRNPTL